MGRKREVIIYDKNSPRKKKTRAFGVPLAMSNGSEHSARGVVGLGDPVISS